MKNKRVIFESTGTVLGHYWCGGKGGYAAKNLSATTKEELLLTANKMLKDGSLDGGMGFESLIGAVLHIAKITIIDVEGKEFKNVEYEAEFIGELTDAESDFLLEVSNY